MITLRPMTNKVWEVMNDLEMVTSKICSAREIIDAAIDRIQEHQYDKAEMMMSAAYEYLEYYLQEFDDKFKRAWQETVVKQKKEEDDAWDAVNKEKEYYEPSMPPWGHSDLEYGVHYSGSTVSSCDKDDSSPECKGAWNSFWNQEEYGLQYTDEEIIAMCDAAEKKDKVVKWQLPVEMDGPSGECFVSFPDDLLEAAGLEEGDTVEWIDQDDGSYLLHKVTKTVKPDEC
jgi:hypothetical protein